MSRLMSRISGRLYGWFECKNPRPSIRPIPNGWSRQARFALEILEAREVPATFTVLNTNDSGSGSLRQAITDANAASGADDIVFSLGSGPSTIALSSALPTITAVGGGLTITGPGANKLTITRNGTAALNQPFNFAGTNTHVLSDFTISGFSGSNAGGAINVAAASNMTFNRMVISDNFSSGFAAGLYMVASGTLTINDSSFINNTSSSNGGAIRMSGSTAGSTATITNSTFTGNKAITGGALLFNSFGGTGVTVSVRNSTITGNTATFTGTTAGYGGGGIARGISTTYFKLNVENSIVSGNSHTGGSADKHDITVNSGAVLNIDGNSVVGVVDANGSFSGTPIDPQLTIVGNYGGKTPTMIPLPGSPALDKYSPGIAGLDQRGFPRPAANADVGAVERQASEPPTYQTVTFTNVTVNDATTNPYYFTIHFFDINTSTLGNNDVRVTGPNSFNTLATFDSFTGDSTSAIAKYKITPPVNAASGWDGSDGGKYTVSVEAGGVSSPGGTLISGGTVGTFQVSIPFTYTVTNLADSGAGSLRQAILDANNNAGTADTIVFQSGLSGTITLTSGQMAISDPLTINGPGASLITIAGGGATRHFALNGAGVIDVTIRGLKLSGGNGSTGVTPTNVFADGGSITSTDENLTLEDMVLSGNSTSGANDGGAISLSTSGNLIIRNSTLSGNTAGSSAGADGGAVYIFSAANVTIDNSTLSGNSANGRGGALYLRNGTQIISNSTISGNVTTSATGTGGGGIAILGTTGSVSIRNSTIVNNSSTSSSTAAGANGGGIASTPTGVTLSIESSVVSGNSTNGAAFDISSAASTGISLLNSAVGSSNGFTQDGSSANNLAFGLNLKLGSLSSNGGATATHLPATDSPLLDKGTNTYNLTTDQRGNGTNTVQFPRSKGTTDIGAVEAGVVTLPTAAATVTNVDNNQVGQSTYTFTVTYTDPSGTIIYETFNDGDEIRVTGPNGFDVPAAFVSVDIPSDGSPRTATYSITAPGNFAPGFDGSDNGTYSVSIVGGQVKNASNTAIAAGVIGSFTVLIPFFTVTNANDSGNGSLRAAILFANSTAGPDMITFDPAFFTSTKTISLVTGLPALVEDVTITGPGSGKVTVTAAGIAGSRQIFNTASAPSGASITLSGMTLTGASFSGNGGAISVGDENLTLTDMTITGNSASSGGGAIYTLSAATLTIGQSTISNNVAGSYGGAIFTDAAATLTIDASTISGNTANGASFGGGALYLTGGSTTISNSTLSGNSIAGTNGGGAIYAWSTPTAVVITSSTLANNTAKQGGAIRIQTGPLTLRNSTVVGNSATTSATSGGGISFASTGLITIESSIIAGNTALGVANDFQAAGTNTVDINNSAWSSAYTPSGLNTDNLANVSLAGMALGTLASNGGPTQTIALGGGSSLLNHGSNSLALTTDQRGSKRESPTGFADIGAYEFSFTGPAAKSGILTKVTQDLPGTNNPYTFTVTYADDTQISRATVGNQPNDDIVVTKVGGGFTTTATFISADQTGDSPVITATYSFTPPGGSWDATDAGTYELSVASNTVRNVGNVGIAATTIGTFTVNFPTTYVVTNTNDSGKGSLRQAILDANANKGLIDTIVFEASTFSTPQTITLTSAELTIDDAVTLLGPGKDLLTISGNSARRIFNINSGIAGDAIGVTIQDMTLTAGSVSGSGGAVFIQDENVTFTRVNITNSKATTSGAAIHVALPNETKLVINGGTFSGNSATTDGGVLNVVTPTSGKVMTVRVSNVSMTGNTAGDDGGAIALGTTSGEQFNVLIESSLLASNITGKGSTTGDGSALYFRGTVGSEGFYIRNSTISGNSAGTSSSNTTSAGAALSFPLVNGTITIQNSTIVRNTAVSTSTDAFDGGGGIAISNSTSPAGAGLLSIVSSVVAENVSANGHPDISSESAVDYSYSAIGTSSFTDGNVLANVSFGTPLGLGTLFNNGGQSLTVSVLAGSPLINAGQATTTPGFPDLTTDQRGPGFARLVGGGVDIGAFERVPGIPSATAGTLQNVVSDQPGVNNPYTFTVTYADDTAISIATVGNQPNDDIRIVRVGGGLDTFATFVSADTSSNSPIIVATYQIIPPGGTWDGNDNGTYEVQLPANAVKNTANTAVPAVTLGSFVVNAPAPAATATAVNVGIDSPSTNPYTFTITFTDANAINVSSIINNNNAVRVTGPNGYDVAATYVTIDNPSNGTPRTATYKITPPVNGATGWDPSDNGGYKILIQGSQVKNLENTFVASGQVGAFSAVIGNLITVTNTNDSGAGSLRDAIALANADPSPDTIQFSTLFNTAQTITLTTGHLLITQPVTIDGPGANLLSIDANKNSRHFYIDDSNTAVNIDVVIKDMKLFNGVVTGTGLSPAARGGAINFGDERLTVDGVWVTGNSTAGGGGGIGGGGGATGGAAFAGALFIYNSTISNNTAKGGDSIQGGGGVLFHRTLEAEIKNSTIAFNTVTGAQGGGVMFYGTGTYTGTPRTARIENSTIIGNSSSSTGGGVGGTSPGSGDSMTFTFLNTIVADNTGSTANQVVTGPINSDFSALTSTGAITGSNNIAPTGLNLSTLQSNGGPTPTIALGTGSLAIDAGPTTSTASFDQRGTGFSRVVGGKADIGAFEVQPTGIPAVTGFTINGGTNPQRSRITTIQVSFTAPLTAADISALQTTNAIRLINAESGPGTLAVRTGGAGTTLDGTITVSGTPGSNMVTLTFTGAPPVGPTDPRAVDFGSLSDGRWRLEIDTVPGGTPEFVSNPSNVNERIRRLFGDVNGDGTVDGGTDFAAFALGNTTGITAAFDFNGDGTIDGGTDFAEFGIRFGRTI